MFRRLLILLAFCTLAFADSVPPSPATSLPPLRPLEAELVAAMQGARVKAGDQVLAKLVHEWTNGQCTLPRGSALVGRVTDLKLRSPQSKVTAVSLSFEAPCAGKPAVPLTWIALLAPDDSDLNGVHDGNPIERQAFRSTSFGEGGGIGGATNTQSNHSDMSGRQDPGFPVALGPEPDRSHPRPSSVAVGQVWRIPNLSLGVAKGAQGSSVLSTTKRDLHVPRGAVLVLFPADTPAEKTAAKAAEGAGPAPGSDSSARTADTTASLRPTFESSEQCAPPSCSVAHRGGPGSGTPPPLQSLSLARLGYHRLTAAEMMDFEYGGALAYLGPHRLLFTFNPHVLVPRANENSADHPRMVRAVLFDLGTAAVASTRDWMVNDDGQYLWPAGADHILVHADGKLRLLNSDLEELASLPLTSRLAFVRLAPDTGHIAVGVMHELHTPEVHASLAAADSNGPEEEVSVLLLDDQLHSIGETRQSSYALPPVLSNAGRIALIHESGEHWRYQETSWSGATRVVAHLRSTCLPKMTSLANGLLFVDGCDSKAIDQRWYRVLRMDGTAVLKGSLSWQETQPLPMADASGKLFAVALPADLHGYRPAAPFHGADLTSEAVSVYRSVDGHHVFTASFHAPTPTRQPMAFEPGGDGLAVLDGEQILIYGMPSEAKQPASSLSSVSKPDGSR